MTEDGDGINIKLNNITINVVQTSSGIFVGNNVQWGWSSHGKSNLALAIEDSNRNTLKNNHNIICDNDYFDTYIDDRDIISNNGNSLNNHDQTINLNEINVNVMKINTGVFTGENNQFGWGSHQKENNNQYIKGNFNRSLTNYNTLYDNDISDTFVNDQDIKIGYKS